MKNFYRTKYGYIDHWSFIFNCWEMAHRDVVILSSHWWDEYHPRWCIMYPLSNGDKIGILCRWRPKKLLDHSTTHKFEALDLLVTKLGFDAGEAQEEIEDTREYHTNFSFLTKNYINHLKQTANVVNDNAHVIYHI